MRRRNLLNVKSLLERIVFICDDIQEFQPNTLPPAYNQELRSICLIAKARLAKQKGRKDIYVESKS